MSTLSSLLFAFRHLLGFLNYYECPCFFSSWQNSADLVGVAEKRNGSYIMLKKSKERLYGCRKGN